VRDLKLTNWTAPPWVKAAEFISHNGTSSADDLALDLIFEGFDHLHFVTDDLRIKESDQILTYFSSRLKHCSTALLVGVLSATCEEGLSSYPAAARAVADELALRGLGASGILKGLER
jgi:hypothetical protein